MTDETTPQDDTAMPPASTGSVAIRSWEQADQIIQDQRAEIARLRLAIRRLADQDATLSVVGGQVVVEVDATLTDAEREALARLSFLLSRHGWAEDGVVLRGLLERLG